MPASVLILGKGYIGTALSEEFVRNNIPVKIISALDADYKDPSILSSYINNEGPFVALVNCSGYTGYPNVDAAEREKEKCHLLNVQTPINIYDVCEARNIRYYHISSGCIYAGYDRFWTEEDCPTFGIDNPDASWYSKTKHMAERALHSEPCYCIRLRMPFSGPGKLGNFHTKDLLGKLIKYDTLVDTLNSKTYIPTLIDFIVSLVSQTSLSNPGRMEIYNYCCQEPLSTKQIVEILKQYGFKNDNWRFVDWDELDIVAKRSNCLLSVTKAINHGFYVPYEIDCIHEALNQG